MIEKIAVGDLVLFFSTSDHNKKTLNYAYFSIGRNIHLRYCDGVITVHKAPEYYLDHLATKWNSVNNSSYTGSSAEILRCS